MSKFTPGEWKAYKRPEPVGFSEWEIHYSEDGECVAEVVHEEADAHLLSAAPDLYEALEALLDEQNGVPLLNREKQYNKAVERARKALAKAEGRHE